MTLIFLERMAFLNGEKPLVSLAKTLEDKKRSSFVLKERVDDENRNTDEKVPAGRQSIADYSFKNCSSKIED